MHMKNKEMRVSSSVILSNELPFVLIAGPCQMESETHAMMMAEKLVKIAQKFNISLQSIIGTDVHDHDESFKFDLIVNFIKRSFCNFQK